MEKQAMRDIVQVRMPGRLTRAIDREARRQMLTRSAFVRRVMAERLGLIEQADNRGQGQREAAA